MSYFKNLAMSLGRDSHFGAGTITSLPMETRDPIETTIDENQPLETTLGSKPTTAIYYFILFSLI